MTTRSLCPIVVTAGLIACSLGSIAGAQANCQLEDPIIADRAIVKIQPGATVQQFIAAFNAAHQGEGVSASLLEQMPEAPGQPDARRLYLLQMTIPPDYTAAQLHALELDLGTNPAYTASRQWAEFEYLAQAPESKTGSVWVDNEVAAVAFGEQYPTTKLGTAAAQQRSTGANVTVAVLDTGIDGTHPELAGALAPGGFNLITNSPNTADVGDGINNDNDGMIDEGVGHGTYVAGLIHLVAPEARLLPVTVLDSEGRSNLWTIAKGVFYAVDRGVEVINMSLATTYDSKAIYESLLEARSRGIVAVAAAGNCNQDEPREFPAMWDLECPTACDEFLLLGVAASDYADVKASFSNFHKNLAFTAPGDSTNAGSGSPNLALSVISTIPGGGYRVWEGTSMGAPLVAGTAALIRSQHPEWPATVQTFHSVHNTMRSTAINIYPQNPQFLENAELGAGLVNAAGATALGPIAPETGDLNADGMVNVNDLLRVVNDWGLTHTSADTNGDGIVNVNDLLIVINQWG